MNLKSLAIAAAAALSLPVFAQSLSIDVAVGQSKVDIDCAGTTRCDDSDTLARAILGYEFAPNWTAELTLAQLGKFSVAANVPPVGNVQVTGKVRSVGLGVAGVLPLNDSFAFTGRLGVASNKTSFSGSAAGISATDSETHTAPYAGIGLSYALSKTVSASLNLDRTQVEYQGDKASVTSVGLGVKWRF